MISADFSDFYEQLNQIRIISELWLATFTGRIILHSGCSFPENVCSTLQPTTGTLIHGYFLLFGGNQNGALFFLYLYHIIRVYRILIIFLTDQTDSRQSSISRYSCAALLHFSHNASSCEFRIFNRVLFGIFEPCDIFLQVWPENSLYSWFRFVFV